MMFELYVTCPKGISHLLVEELKQLGVQSAVSRVAGVACRASLQTLYQVCLWSRLANRVLVNLHSWQAATAEEVYSGAMAIDWSQHMQVSATFAIQATVTSTTNLHSQFMSLKVKDAIADYFRQHCGERPSVDVEQPDLRFHVHLNGKTAQLSLDISGQSLHRRGYRQQQGEAPLKENLAAALLVQAGWSGVQQYALDPMCGSATLLIEAALIATDTAPGLLSHATGFNHWRQHDAALWNQCVMQAEQRRQQGMQRTLHLRGFDQDASVIAAARKNIEAAGMQRFIKVSCSALQQVAAEEFAGVSGGLLICNPPYGERLGEVTALRGLYAALGRLMRDTLPMLQVAILSANEDLIAYTGCLPEVKTDFYNGAIECQLYQFTTARQVDALTQSDFANRLRKNLRHRQRWAKREQVSCYRIYDADLPEYALAIDYYHSITDDAYVHVQEYQAPKSIDPALAMQRLQTAILATQAILQLPFEHLYLKVRRQQKGSQQYQKEQAEQQLIKVSEGNACLLVNLGDYLDTGLFLDHRNTRQWIARHSNKTRFLNLFCYTATASVHAALGGASASLSIDMSATYLEWARRNFQANRLNLTQHQLLQADCMVWLEQQAAARTSERYDIIFLDPPTFSNSKRMQQVLDIQRDHEMLIQQCMRLLSKDGVLIFSCNFRKFRLAPQLATDYAVEDVTGSSIPEDFARSKIHQCWHIRQRR